MIEQILYNFLSKELDTPVYFMRPDNAPESYVVVEKTTGGYDNHVPTATIAVQSYAPTVYGAIKLNEQVKAAMKRALALPEIGRCKCTNDYNFTDLTRKVPRYQAVFDVRYYQ